MTLVKSKQRVVDRGEVFTPPWMVDAMLDLVKAESERIDAQCYPHMASSALDSIECHGQITYQASLPSLVA